MPQDSSAALAHCLARVEARLGWPPAAEWQSSHFERLSERIHDDTGVRLSSATLKRVWGRVRYDSSPSRTTLDTLAQFAGYAGWVELEAEYVARAARPPASSSPHTPPQEPAAPPAKPARPTGRTAWRAGLVGVAAAVLAAILLATVGSRTRRWAGPPAEVVRFEFAPVTQGLPNTVQFRYAVNGGDYDSMSIQQSWDARRRQTVDPGRGFHASTYHYPGAYRAKLLLDTTVVAERPLVIPSGGWLGTRPVAGRETPAYVSADSLRVGGDGAYRLAAADPAEIVALHHVSGFPELGDAADTAFTLRATLRNEGELACRHALVTVHGERGALLVPLAAPGCTGEIDLYAAGDSYPGSDYDLSGFGVAAGAWVALEVVVADSVLVVRVDGREAFRQNLSRLPGRPVGVRWQFQGGGAVRELEVAGG